MKNNDNFYVCLTTSITIHLLGIYIFLFGLPHFSKKYMDYEEQVVTFEMLVVNDVSNVQNQQKQSQKIKSESLEEKQIKKEKSEVESKDEVIIQEKKKPKKKPTIQEEKPRKKEIKKKILNNSDLESLLKTLEQSSKSNKTKSDKHSSAKENNVSKESKELLNVLISEQNLIQQHIQKYWIIPIAAQNREAVVVNLYIALNKNGSVAKVKILEKICPNIPSSVCQALADSAQRAVWQASPIQNLLPENYHKWKEFNLSFYPKDIP